MASEKDISDIIDTLIAEGYGEGPEGMRRIAETIINRAAQSGMSPAEVVRQRKQYTGYAQPGPEAVKAQKTQAARTAAEAAFQLALQPGDPTGGADHYINPRLANPAWAGSMQPTGEFQNHAFFASKPVPQSGLAKVASSFSIPSKAPTPVMQSDDMRLMRGVMGNAAPPAIFGGDPLTPSNGPVIASIPTRGQSYAGQDRARPSPFNGDPLTASTGPTIASIPTSSAFNGDPLTPSNGPTVARIPTVNVPQRLPTLPASTVGTAPSTRSVQSVAMPPISQTPARVPLSTGVQQSYAGQDRASTSRPVQLPTQAQLVAATGFTGAVPDRLPAGFNIPNTTNARGIAGVGTNGVAPIPYARPSGLTIPSQFATAPTNAAPVPTQRPTTAAVPAPTVASQLSVTPPVAQPSLAAPISIPPASGKVAPVPAKRIDRTAKVFGVPVPGILGGFMTAMNNATGPFNNGGDNLLYNVLRGGDYNTPGAATAQAGGYLFAPKAGGGYTNVGRANPNLSPAQTYEQLASRSRESNSSRGKSDWFKEATGQ